MSALDTGRLYSPGNTPDTHLYGGQGNSVHVTTDYGLDGPGSNPGEDEIFRPSRLSLGAHPASCTMGTGSFLGVKCGRGVTLTPHPFCAMVKKEYSYTSTSPMVRTACTEPQCLYKGVLYLLPLLIRSSRQKMVEAGYCKSERRHIYIIAILIENLFFMARQPPVGHGLLIHEVSRSHATTHHSR